MAPEVVRCPLKAHPDDNKADTRFHYNAVVDTWAVGCLAYELVAGAPPFMAETQQDVVRNINTKEVGWGLSGWAGGSGWGGWVGCVGGWVGDC
jgi:serine/threonine protein kinase